MLMPMFDFRDGENSQQYLATVGLVYYDVWPTIQQLLRDGRDNMHGVSMRLWEESWCVTQFTPRNPILATHDSTHALPSLRSQQSDPYLMPVVAPIS